MRRRLLGRVQENGDPYSVRVGAQRTGLLRGGGYGKPDRLGVEQGCALLAQEDNGAVLRMSFFVSGGAKRGRTRIFAPIRRSTGRPVFVIAMHQLSVDRTENMTHHRTVSRSKHLGDEKAGQQYRPGYPRCSYFCS